VVFISIGLPICTFYSLTEELAQGFHVISWDSRGYPSFNDGVETSNLSVARHVEDFVEIVNQVGRRRVLVVSYSAGSTVAVRAAVTHRDLIERMVLIGGSFNLPEDIVGEIPQYQSRRLYQKMTLNRDEAELARRRFLLNLKQGGMGIQAKGDPVLEALKYCVEFMFESREAAFRYAHLQIGLSKENVVDLLPQVPIQTMVSVASDDKLGCLAANVYVSERLPHAILKTYEGAGHWSVYLHRTMLRDVGTFLAGEAN
jgi:pimeloyl-ACP methyl ester carboxylesterase